MTQAQILKQMISLVDFDLAIEIDTLLSREGPKTTHAIATLLYLASLGIKDLDRTLDDEWLQYLANWMNVEIHMETLQ